MVRRSIVELCARDHENNPLWLDQWLANKTPETMAGWIADPNNRMFVAVADGAVLAAGCVKVTGDIVLNYVSPDCRFMGISRAMLQRLEDTARGYGHCRVRLISTVTAHDFYLRAGYIDRTDDALKSDGELRMEKLLA